MSIVVATVFSIIVFVMMVAMSAGWINRDVSTPGWVLFMVLATVSIAVVLATSDKGAV